MTLTVHHELSLGPFGKDVLSQNLSFHTPALDSNFPVLLAFRRPAVKLSKPDLPINSPRNVSPRSIAPRSLLSLSTSTLPINDSAPSPVSSLGSTTIETLRFADERLKGAGAYTEDQHCYVGYESEF